MDLNEKLAEEERRGAEARALLSNKLFTEAWGAAEQSILDQMDEVSLRDTDMHTRLILAKQILHRVQAHVVRHIQTGKMARISLDQKGRVRQAFSRVTQRW